MSIRPKQMARIGEFYLQEALLDVLCDAFQEGYGIGAAELSRRTGIYRDAAATNMNDAIVHGLLNQAFSQGKVERAEQNDGQGGWRLTAQEYDRRRDDIELG